MGDWHSEEATELEVTSLIVIVKPSELSMKERKEHRPKTEFVEDTI